MASVLDKLVDNQGSSYKSNSWYRNNVKKIYDKATARKLMNQGKLIGRPSVGRLNLFFYDPKTKDRLPYYDRFPLVLPLETIKGGFMGLNFHYLPPVLRLKLLEEMSQWSVKNDLSKNNRFDVSYNRVSGIPLIRPTIKKYLWSHVRSSFLRIDVGEAAIACYLPVQQFKKRSAAYVYGQSRGMI
tara:strand:+ start:121 stop:675 length:555 start_codon:yes stop_codon:yes gene_type:complete